RALGHRVPIGNMKRGPGDVAFRVLLRRRRSAEIKVVERHPEDDGVVARRSWLEESRLNLEIELAVPNAGAANLLEQVELRMRIRRPTIDARGQAARQYEEGHRQND